jgi:vacuolar protein sorting-associated protein 13A/C
MIPNDIVNNSGSSSSSNDDNNNRETHPFFNIAASYSKGDVKQNEPIKFTYFSYLIQAFYINIDNEIFEGVVGFINSITQQLNTSINKVHPILRKNTTTINSSSNTCNNVLYLEPEWLNNNNIISNSSNIFFTHFESSSIEMILSFKASSALEQFLTSNPLFTKVLSSLSNIEHSHLLLNGSFMNNLYISYPNLINLILNQYKQHFLTKLLTIVGSIEILGNPLNLFRSLSIGVKDFVTKPIEGIVRGPLDGVEGAIQGGYSLIKHTINGAFSYTSNIASGISKSILHLSQDDTYIKAIEKEKIETQPKNFVFGLGYGISSLCNGVFSGICDAVIKPIEETQKKGITGLGTGIVKGIGGLFSKPVVGVLQLVSNTSDGIKNTFQTYNDDECGYSAKCKQIRRKRPFYGKFKCIKKYNVVHAKLLEFVVMEIEVFKNAKRKIDFVDVETYRNVKGEDNIVLFLTKSIVFVDVIRRCVKEEIPFTVINKAEVDKRKESVCIYFNKEFKGKIQAEVYLKKGDCEEGDSIAKKVNAYVKQ